jgi:hypothetical protein
VNHRRQEKSRQETDSAGFSFNNKSGVARGPVFSAFRKPWDRCDENYVPLSPLSRTLKRYAFLFAFSFGLRGFQLSGLLWSANREPDNSRCPLADSGSRPAGAYKPQRKLKYVYTLTVLVRQRLSKVLLYQDQDKNALLYLYSIPLLSSVVYKIFRQGTRETTWPGG